MTKKSIILMTSIPLGVAAVATATTLTVLALTQIKHMQVEEITKSKEIECDSDKEPITYQFKQQVTPNFLETKVTLVDFKVHNQTEEPTEDLLKTTLKSDGSVDVVFDTQLFIYNYLAKYYEVTKTNDYIPTTYKFRLYNEADRSEYVSSEFKLTVTPAEYAIACSSESEHLKFSDEEKSVKVYYPYQGTYSLDDKYTITNRRIMRYDGVQLYGKAGVIFENGEIYIPWPYVTGPITISASAMQTTFNVDTIGLHVTYSGFKSTVELNQDIDGTFAIDDGYSAIQDSCGIWVGDTKLTDGYTIDFTNNKIHIDGAKVKDNVTIYIATDLTTFSVGYKGNNVKFADDRPTSITKQTQISTTYTIDDGYEIDDSTTYVTVNGVEQKTGWTIADGKIVINAAIVTGNIVINVGTKESPTVVVTATGDHYVEFAKPQKAYQQKEYKLTYKLHYGSLKSVSVVVGSTTLTTDKYTCANGVLTIKAGVIDSDTVTITATGNPTSFSFSSDFDDRIHVESYTSPINYMVDFKCKIALDYGYSTITGWGCAVGGDETYTQYLEYDSDTKTFTLPGQYVKGNIKIWASLA